MKPSGPEDPAGGFEQELQDLKKQKYVLRLYVTGMTEKSRQAIQNIKEICDSHLDGFYDLEIIDIYRNPVLAKGDQIVATPTLIKKLPAPIRKFIGDMSATEKILLGLDLRLKM